MLSKIPLPKISINKFNTVPSRYFSFCVTTLPTSLGGRYILSDIFSLSHKIGNFNLKRTLHAILIKRFKINKSFEDNKFWVYKSKIYEQLNFFYNIFSMFKGFKIRLIWVNFILSKFLIRIKSVINQRAIFQTWCITQKKAPMWNLEIKTFLLYVDIYQTVYKLYNIPNDYSKNHGCQADVHHDAIWS